MALSDKAQKILKIIQQSQFSDGQYFRDIAIAARVSPARCVEYFKELEAADLVEAREEHLDWDGKPLTGVRMRKVRTSWIYYRIKSK